MKTFAEYLNEGIVQDGHYKVEKLNLQTPGKAAVSETGKEIPGSIALNKNDFATVDGDGIVMHIMNSNDKKVFIVDLPKKDLMHLKKLL